MKNNKGLLIALISMLSIVILLLVAIMILILSKNIKLPKNFNLSFGNVGQSSLIYEKIYETNNISNIEINSLSSDIDFKESENDALTIKVYGNKKSRAEEINKEDIVGVNYNEGSGCIGFCFNNNSRIVISIPKNYDKNIKLSTKSGDVELIDLPKCSAIINSMSGDIKTGDILILKATTISGEIDSKNILNKVSAKTTSGDINISSLNILENSNLNSVSGDISIDKINDIYIESSTTSGDIKIKNNNRLAKNILKIKTVSGDINVY